EKTDISENRASRNFDLMINIMTFEHSSSSIGHQCLMMSDNNSSDLTPQRQEISVENVSSGLVPQGQKASDYDNSDPVPPRQNVVPSQKRPNRHNKGLNFSSVLFLKNFTIQHTVSLRKTTMIKHRMDQVTKMIFSILFVHGYKKLVSLAHA
ncbi:hypothetical protein Tco_0392045, partial [Tanacetum coccineum]